MNLFRIFCLLGLTALHILGCSESASSDSQNENTTANARVAEPALGPGNIIGDLYIHEFLNLEIPVIQGWETGSRDMVEQMFEQWNPAEGIDSLPSMFLLNVGRVMPPDVKGIRSHYFLQIEPASLYPVFAGDAEAYLSQVGEQLTSMARQEIVQPVTADSLDQREVYRMDVAFQFGEFPGRQSYFSWVEKGLFVNLVFTYENDEDWNLIQSAVLDLMHLK